MDSLTSPEKAAITYRNSCLAVLVGDVGKSSSLCKEFKKKKEKRKKSRRKCETVVFSISKLVLHL